MANLVRFEVRDRIAHLTLDEPARRNALSRNMLAALRDALVQVAADRDVRVVIIDANGPAFSAGHDLRELAGASAEGATSLFALCTEVMEAIRALPQPVIAQVDGVATAAGCQLVATCDLAVASETATFATPGVKIGLFCSTPAVALARVVPAKKGLEMLLTGAPISAAEAERIGLVNRVVPKDRLAAETLSLAQQIVQASGATVTLGKRAFHAQLSLDRPAAYAVAQHAMVENSQMHDAQEGMAAFLEKRPPVWRD